MALLPPPNGAGIPVPQNPDNPPTLNDIANAVSYVSQLTETHVYHRFPITATRDEIALAETYKTALVFAQNPQAAPAWLAQLMATVNQISQDVADLRTKSAEQPAILYNSRAGPNEPLYDPIAYGQGLGYVPLAHPATRDELLRLDRNQSIASAAALGLPVMPTNSEDIARQRQIGDRIGVRV